MFDDDLILHPEKGGTLRFFSSLFPGRNEHGFEEYPEQFSSQNRWIIQVSIVVIKILHSAAKPMGWIGCNIEFLLNLLSNNEGFTGIIHRLLRGHGVITPEEDTENFISFIGHLDRRLDLSHTTEKIIELGSSYCADISVMASKLAYENEYVIKNVVTKSWKIAEYKFICTPKNVFGFCKNHRQTFCSADCDKTFCSADCDKYEF